MASDIAVIIRVRSRLRDPLHWSAGQELERRMSDNCALTEAFRTIIATVDDPDRPGVLSKPCSFYSN